MKRTPALAWLLAGGILLPALAGLAVTPYDGITARNSFSLLPPPPEVPPAPPVPPANIKLTGIINLDGEKKAMMMVQDTSGPGKPDLSVILREGQREGQIEVIEINEPLAYVKVKNNGDVATLTFDTVKGGAAPPPAMPGALTAPGQVLNPPRPGVPNPTTTAIEQPRPRGGLRQIPTRQLRLPGGGPGGDSGGAANTPTPPPNPQPSLSPEEQAALLLLEQEKQKNDPQHP